MQRVEIRGITGSEEALARIASAKAILLDALSILNDIQASIGDPEALREAVQRMIATIANARLELHHAEEKIQELKELEERTTICNTMCAPPRRWPPSLTVPASLEV